MYDINNINELKTAISLLEDELAERQRLVEEQLNVLHDSFSPVNIVRDVFREVATSEDFRANVLTATMGITTGYISKRLVFRKNDNLLKSIAGNLFQYGIANLVINPYRILKTMLLPVLEIFSAKKKKPDSLK